MQFVGEKRTDEETYDRTAAPAEVTDQLQPGHIRSCEEPPFEDGDGEYLIRRAESDKESAYSMNPREVGIDHRTHEKVAEVHQKDGNGEFRNHRTAGKQTLGQKLPAPREIGKGEQSRIPEFQTVVPAYKAKGHRRGEITDADGKAVSEASRKREFI